MKKLVKVVSSIFLLSLLFLSKSCHGFTCMDKYKEYPHYITQLYSVDYIKYGSTIKKTQT